MTSPVAGNYTERIVNRRVPLSTIRPHPDNPNTHPDSQIAQLEESHNYFGQFRSALLWQRPDGYMIVAGHGYLTGAYNKHAADIRADILPEDTPSELVAQIMAADNAHGRNSIEDPAKLLSILEKAQELNVPLSILGVSQAQLDALYAEIEEDLPTPEPGDGGDDFDATPATDGPTRTHAGELWQLGPHRLFVGDSTRREDVERLMDGQRAAICLTSPPYNTGVSAKLSGNTHIKKSVYIRGEDDNVDIGDYLSLLCKFTDCALACCDYVFVNIQMLAGNKMALVDYLAHYKNHLADIAIWDKQQAQPAAAERVMTSQYEFLVILSPKDAPNRAIGTAPFRGTVSNVYSGLAQRANEFSDLHAATFPLHFPTWVIENFTQEQDGVLDLFGGTGTTLIACHRLERVCYMMELEPRYADVILSRFTAECGIEPERIEHVAAAIKTG